MRAMRLFGLTLFCLILWCSHILLLPNPVLAKHPLPWCGCGMCYMAQYGSCTCGYPYYWCLDDQDSGKFRSSLAPSLATSSSTSKDLSSIIAGRIDGTEGVIALMRGPKCLHNQLTFNLLEDALIDFKVAPVPTIRG